LGVLAVDRYVSEAWFGRQLTRHPPAYRRVRNGPTGMALIITGTVLLLAVSISLPFLNVKLLGLIVIVAGLVKVRALQEASSWLWRNRRMRNGPARPLAGPAPLLRHGQPEPVRLARPELTRPAGMALIMTGTVLLLAVSISLPFLNVKLHGLIVIVAGLVKVRALQRASSWLWQNRREVMATRVPLDTLPEASAPVACRARRRDRRAGADQLADGRFTVTVIVPAYNEEGGIRDTLDALMQQTARPERIIVVDDCSQDNTGPVAREYGVEVLRPPHNLGSKAKAQNYALPYCATDLVLPVDADTILAADYVEHIKRPFEDPRVVIAAGNVQTKVTRTVTERGRSIEYLYGFHFYRPIQNRAGAPVVCSGCCSAFRREILVASGGFPERTIVEDFDWTATQQIAGNKAVYVAAAEAWAADPETIRYLRKQMNRWMSGFFQNMRIHFWPAWRHKPVLAIWYSVAIAEILMLPLWWGGPLLWVYVWHDPFLRTFEWWIALQLAVNIPVLMYAAVRRRVNPLSVLVNFPLVYVNGAVNSFYAWKAMIVELVLVPLGIARGLTVYEKGR
jgi:cellulose synthase/poly-beta-1,6-N-acetylglucosamine synthase-like glycosyltransferase